MSMFELIEYQLGLIRWADANPDKWYKHELYRIYNKHLQNKMLVTFPSLLMVLVDSALAQYTSNTW